MLVTEKLDKPFEEIKAHESIVFTCDYCGYEFKKKMMNDEELLAIKEKLYDSEKYPYINCRLIAKKLFEELAKLKAEAISSQAETLSNADVLGSDLSCAIILQNNLTANMTGADVLNAYLNGMDAISINKKTT